MNASAMGTTIDQGKLRSDGQSQRDAQQYDAAPVPQHDFARSIQGVRDRDRGEDGSKGSPGRAGFRLGKPQRAGAR